MSRAASGEAIQIRPTNNVYTALAGVAVVVQILGLIAILLRAKEVGGIF